MLTIENCGYCEFCEGHKDDDGNIVWYCSEYTGHIEDKSRLENIDDCEWART